MEPAPIKQTRILAAKRSFRPQKENKTHGIFICSLRENHARISYESETIQSLSSLYIVDKLS
ncbi:unnamed protein product, partial [Dovyalis caffra]